MNYVKECRKVRKEEKVTQMSNCLQKGGKAVLLLTLMKWWGTSSPSSLDWQWQESPERSCNLLNIKKLLEGDARTGPQVPWLLFLVFSRLEALSWVPATWGCCTACKLPQEGRHRERGPPHYLWGQPSEGDDQMPMYRKVLPNPLHSLGYKKSQTPATDKTEKFGWRACHCHVSPSASTIPIYCTRQVGTPGEHRRVAEGAHSFTYLHRTTAFSFSFSLKQG